jgi:hypothetical protein
MVFYGGVFMKEEVSVLVIDHESLAPYLIQATMDLTRHWSSMGFSRYSTSHICCFVFISALGTKKNM